MTVYEITIDAEKLQRMKAQREARDRAAVHLLTGGRDHLTDIEEAVEALLRVYDAHCESEADVGFIAPEGAAAAVNALVAHYGVDRVRALLEGF